MNHLLRRVHKRNGRHEDYQPAKVAGSILRAAEAAGEADPLWAEELSAVATMVLERDHPTGEPHTADIREVVERVLMETGHLEVVRRFIVYGQRRRDGGALVARDRGPVDERSLLRVASAREERLDPFVRSRLAADLVLECGMDAEEADAVADRVERRLVALDLETVPASLLEDLVEVELAERGLADALAVRQRFGVSRGRLDTWVSQRTVGGVERAIGEEILRRYNVGALLEPELARRHLEGELEIDGLGDPRRALACSVHCGALRRVKVERGVAALVKLARGLRESTGGTVFLAHVERGLAPLEGADRDLRAVARELLLGLAGGVGEPGRLGAPQTVLALGTDLPPDQLSHLFHRGVDAGAVRERAAELVRCLIREAMALAPFVEVPRLRLLLRGGWRDGGADSPTSAPSPGLDLGNEAYRAIQHGLVEFALSDQDVRPLRMVGARVGINVGRVALRCGRRQRGEFLAGLRVAVRAAVAAAARRLRLLQELDDAAVGPSFRVRDLIRELSREFAFDLPGRHGYHCAVIPIGLDAAVRALTERDPEESDEAARVRDEALAWMREDLPADSGSAARFELSEEPFVRAERRFGRLDFATFPRGRDILRLAHDGEAFRYGKPDAHQLAARVLDPGLDQLWTPEEAELEHLLGAVRARTRSAST